MGKRQRARRGSDQIQRRVDKRGLVTFYARYTEAGARKFAVLKATDDRAAKLELAEMLIRIRKGEPAVAPVESRPGDGLTVRQLAERYCGWTEDKATRFAAGAGDDNRHPKKYRAQFWSVLDCHVLPHVGALPAAEVRRADLVRMLDALHGVGPRTVEKSIRNTSKLFNWALERELVKVNPAFKLKGPRYKSKSDFYRDDEVARLLSKAAETGSDLYPLIACAYYSGMRKGELAALQRGDVDLDGGRIDVSRSWGASARKSGEALTVHVHPCLSVILRAHIEAQGDLGRDALVFPDAGGGMRDEYDLWGLDELVTAAEVRRFLRPWHSFRHSHGTSLAASGASLPEIQEALGQSSMEMARRYVKVAGEQVRKRVMALPALGPAPVVDLGQARRQNVGKRPATQNG